MVCDTHFLRLNYNYSYDYNMKSVDLSDQLRNVYRVDHWMRKCEWWWSLFFWGHGLVLANAYIIYKTLCEEVKVKPMSHYEFRRLVCLTKVDIANCGGRDHLVSAVQRRVIIKKYGYTHTTTVSERE